MAFRRLFKQNIRDWCSVKVNLLWPDRLLRLKVHVSQGEEEPKISVRFLPDFHLVTMPKRGITPVYTLYCTGVLDLCTYVYTWLDTPKKRIEFTVS